MTDIDVNIIRQSEDGYAPRWEERTYTRDYWLRLYAGMALQGVLLDPNLSTEAAADLAVKAATKLVDKLFQNEQPEEGG